jgi:UDP-N-acetylmuramoyl-tripeptide--D-alanyl-D-alanine ligase
MAAALDLLAEIPGRRIAVLGDMRELGAAEREGHMAVGRRAAETADVIHTIGDLGETIAVAARDGGHDDVHHWPNKEQAAAAVLRDLHEADRVLVKGSRAMALETVVEALRQD